MITKYLNEIINESFKDEKVKDVSKVKSKFDCIDANNCFKVETEQKNYYVKIKKNLNKEVINNGLLGQALKVPNIYRYSKTNDHNCEYIIEDYIEGVSLNDMIVQDTHYTNVLFLAGQAFGKAFNIKKKDELVDESILYKMDKKDQTIYYKYFTDKSYDGFILIDVEYMYSVIDNKAYITVVNLGNCVYDDIRPFLMTYEKKYGAPFISGFKSTSNIDYKDLIIDNMDEYVYIRRKKEGYKKFGTNYHVWEKA